MVTLGVQAFILAAVAVLLVVEATNMRRMRPMQSYPSPPSWPRASILVPARDEEADIGACLRSLLSQDYPDFEVLALDDHSSDGTRAIMERIAAEDGRLRVLTGGPLPEGWLGKSWACAQLAAEATGDVLLFTDADTRHDPRSLRSGVAALTAENADLVTAVPHEEAVTLGERLVLPAIPWSTATFLPLEFAYGSGTPGISVSNGQFLLFRRASYESVGGHESVRDEILEDMELGKRVRASGRSWRIVDATDLVATRMYRDLREVFSGLGKNMFGIFGYGLGRYLVSWAALALVFLTPAVTLLAAAARRPVPGFSLPLMALAWVATVAEFGIAYRRFGYPPTLAVLYPLTFTLVLAVAVWSLLLSLDGSATWKGRRLGRTRLRWL